MKQTFIVPPFIHPLEYRPNTERVHESDVYSLVIVRYWSKATTMDDLSRVLKLVHHGNVQYNTPT